MKNLIFIISLATSFTAQAQDVTEVRQHIKTLAGDVSNETKIAQYIVKASLKYQVEAKVLVALLMVESTFRHHVISHTGDLGISQINPKVWGEEFTRRGLKPLDITLLKKDMGYAIDRTAQILSLFKKAGYHNYYGIYHSKTPSLRRAYTKRIQAQLTKLNAMTPTMTLALK